MPLSQPPLSRVSTSTTRRHLHIPYILDTRRPGPTRARTSPEILYNATLTLEDRRLRHHPCSPGTRCYSRDPSRAHPVRPQRAHRPRHRRRLYTSSPASRQQLRPGPAHRALPLQRRNEHRLGHHGNSVWTPSAPRCRRSATSSGPSTDAPPARLHVTTLSDTREQRDPISTSSESTPAPLYLLDARA